MTDERKEMLAQIRKALDESSDNLDPATLGLLRERRRRALAGEPARASGTGRFRQWCTAVLGGGDGGTRAPAAYLLTSVAIVVVAGWFWLSRPAELADVSVLGNLDLLTAAEDPEFYEQLDFYIWMEHEEQG